MSDIEFIQYLPNGRRKKILIDRPEEITNKARLIKSEGYRFECAIAMDGKIVLAIADETLDAILDRREIENGPGIPPAVDDLIRGFQLTRTPPNRIGARVS